MTDENSMAAAIVPKSDQINADDCMGGPITIKITKVTVRGGQEQPVTINYENDNGKPYKPCKSMARVFVKAWGLDKSQYPGRSVTLYCDSSVKWGGLEVGGLRISHMTDLPTAPEPMTVILTSAKGSRKPFTVRPLAIEPPSETVDWNAEILGSQTIEELGKVWARVPKALKGQLTLLKDARKTELSNAAP